MKWPSLQGLPIAIIQQSLELGGAERQGILLASMLQNRCGADAVIWGFGQPLAAAKLCDKLGVPWRALPYSLEGNKRQRLFSMARLSVALRKTRPSVLMPYTMPPNVACGLMWHTTGARTCVWNQRDEGRQRVSHAVEHWAVRLTPWFLSNSENGADFLQHTLNVPQKRISVIHNGVTEPTVEHSRQEWRSNLGISDDAIVACMVANLHPNKDHTTLIEAWAQATRMLPPSINVCLLFAGYDSGFGTTLRRMTSELGISTIRFLGQVRDIGGLFNASDICAFSSKIEGMPNGVLEGMASGLPVVATNIPGIREAVGEAGEPYLCPPNDPASLAQKLCELIQDAKRRKELGTANLERARTKFSPDQMGHRTAELISQWLQ